MRLQVDAREPRRGYVSAMPRPRTPDVAAAVGIAVLSELEVWAFDMWPGSEPVNAVLAPLPPLALLAARHRPLIALIAAVFVYSTQTAAFDPPEGPSQAFTVFLLVLACAALGGEHRWSALPLTAAMLAVANITDSGGVDPAAWVFPLFFFGLAYLVGSAIRRRDQRASLLVREQETVAEAAVLDERARIARELHDVVAHGISVIVVQAVGGRAALNAADHPASGAFDAIESTGKQALAEMRRLLGVLRSVDHGTMLLPQPGLRDLEQLVHRARGAGLTVELGVTGTSHPLTPGVDLCAYRILQEALTNAIKHARATHVHVQVRYEPDAIALEIRDDGRVRGGASANRTGHGLLGMRERVELYGGDLRAGPEPSGGFAVRARLPLEAA